MYRLTNSRVFISLFQENCMQITASLRTDATTEIFETPKDGETRKGGNNMMMYLNHKKTSQKLFSLSARVRKCVKSNISLSSAHETRAA